MLHYVGFNGYKQCPETDDKTLPKIITDWISIPLNGIIGIKCRHRFLLSESQMVFTLHGLVTEQQSLPWTIEKPGQSIDCFEASDECLMASVGTVLWKYSFKDQKWIRPQLNFSKSHNNIWTQSDNKVTKMSYRMDSNTFIILLNKGSVWAFTQENNLHLLFPSQVDKAIDVSSGLEHTLILTESGCVLSFGNGSRGQLGTGNLDSIQQPVQISTLEGLKINKISTGYWHSCAITDSGDLCTWGWNNFGQLAAFQNGQQLGLTAFPHFVDVVSQDDFVVDVACGSRHTIAQLENGNLYVVGWNAYSQLGIDSSSSSSSGNKISTFTKVTLENNRNLTLLPGPWYTILLDQPTPAP